MIAFTHSKLELELDYTSSLLTRRMTIDNIFAGDERSWQSQSPGFYYTSVTSMQPAFVWTSTKKEWNAQNAFDHARLGYLPRKTYAKHNKGAKAC